MKQSATEYNARGIELEDAGDIAEAEAWYRQAADAAPEWAVPWYNLGLLYKRQRRWSDSLRAGRRAVELDPSEQDAWWNVGIAATALGDWRAAREAWTACGIEMPAGDGPPEMRLGMTPIRVNPSGDGEVLWCDRIDPARAIIRNVPLPESGHRFKDLLLHDGAPNGYRMSRGREVPVFDALAILAPSSFSTWEVVVEAPSPDDCVALEELAQDRGLGAEDWSTIRRLCVMCSEGRPHASHDWVVEYEPARRWGIAAHSESDVREILARWSAEAGREIESLRRVLEARSHN
ncbi:MAG TPA: tetratricopeptide repeat protein [Herpetosiphonaceae bacterium]|nr:tetratricopeptide repeat protein [Herpetosiphonaceae bacterium]